MGDPDLTPNDPRGFVVFPDEPANARQARPAGEWWLVLAALLVAAGMIAIAFALR